MAFCGLTKTGQIGFFCIFWQYPCQGLVKGLSSTHDERCWKDFLWYSITTNIPCKRESSLELKSNLWFFNQRQLRSTKKSNNIVCSTQKPSILYETNKHISTTLPLKDLIFNLHLNMWLCRYQSSNFKH